MKNSRNARNVADTMGLHHVSIIIVHYNTKHLLIRATNSIPENIPIIIVENGAPEYTHNDLPQETKIVAPRKQMYHGDGLHFGIQHTHTKYFVAMDSDAYIKDPNILDIMRNILSNQPKTYGVGYVTRIDQNGHDDWNKYSNPPYFDYLHPYFCMVNRNIYDKGNPYVHHGAPAIRAMQSAEKVHNLTYETMQKYIHHDGRGTRNITQEYLKGWE